MAALTTVSRRHIPSADRTSRLRLFIILILCVCWEGVSRSGIVFAGAIPPILTIVDAVFDLLTSSVFYGHALVSLSQIVIGLAIATILGISFGIFMGMMPLLGSALGPYIEGVGSAPKIIFLPVALATLGYGPESKIGMAVLGGFFPIVLSTYAGSLQVKPIYLRVAQSFQFNTLQTVTKIYIPALIVPIVSGIRLGFGSIVVTVVLAEAKIGNVGLGYLAINYYNIYVMSYLYAVLFILFIIGYLGNTLFTIIPANIGSRNF